ncbi:hypothetical protein DCS_00467 [Drechmeria coniospora]|uniref:DUF202 domain-containing protein n=1 Tax=Drechmeria coniospora TaxID=98403 RepID=A0A151GQE9_DRECN|nr:hypothetical protein DCS_00467 [Drechmeria coniospora]KYK59337.1 hypothetical protein DCS_00467 [Drechmeria coniospora]
MSRTGCVEGEDVTHSLRTGRTSSDAVPRASSLTHDATTGRPSSFIYEYLRWPAASPLIVENASSDARDHCANERTRSDADPGAGEAFLSSLRLALYMAVVAIAITLSFHLTHQPTDLERRMAKPLGAIFWALSVVTLFMGFGNYISERARRRPPACAACREPGMLTEAYALRNDAQVQPEDGDCPVGVEDPAGEFARAASRRASTNWHERPVQVLALLATCIIGTCIVLLVVTKLRPSHDDEYLYIL